MTLLPLDLVDVVAALSNVYNVSLTCSSYLSILKYMFVYFIVYCPGLYGEAYGITPR